MTLITTRRRFLQRAAGLAALAGFGLARPAWALQDSEISADERAALAALATGYMSEHGATALSVAVARHGRFVYAQGFGIADPRTGAKVTPAQLFRIASISKPITAVAIFSLIERGSLALGDKVFGEAGILKTDYGKTPYGPYVEDITVEHLLTHATGVWPNKDGDPMFIQPKLNLAQLIGWTLANRPLTEPPGRSFVYSNVGFALLGRVIEKVTGKAYPDYVREAVFERCGISQMRIGGSTLAQRAADEVVYVGQKANPYGANIARLDSCAGWIASPSDLVRFAMHVDGRFGVTGILRPETVRIMLTPSNVRQRYAKGWATNGRNWWHNGSLTSTSAIMVRTESGLCWAALANTRRRESDKATDRYKVDSVADIAKMSWQMVRAVKSWAVDARDPGN
jgi:CubicO group peptidase (beta-lactamase class C family)